MFARPILNRPVWLFYTPTEWERRGEQYGLGAELIVAYDGGDLAYYFNLDRECYDLHEEMQLVLAEIGVYFEECTCWYSAIYSLAD